MQSEKPDIVFEDDSFLIIGKPSGWITNEASTTKDQPVLQTWIRENLKFPISNNREFRNGIVHRLDKETSGALIVAKTEHSFTELQRQFKERVVSKTYRALVHGVVNPDKGVVDVPVGRLPWRRDRFGVLPGGREAYTSYEVVNNYRRKFPSEKFSLLELYPKTGRTHQIRIHMKHLNHPLVADEFYAGRKTARNDRKWCARLFLHAYSISFLHPESGEKVSYSRDLASDLENVLSSLEKES